MDKIYDICCGIDVHKKLIVACLNHKRKKELREFGATTRELMELAEWLQKNECEIVAMESTGSYWKPLYNIMESYGLHAIVVNPAHMKAVPGRKTDVKDAEWIAELLQHGLLQPSYIPSKDQRELRELVQYRKSLVGERTRELNRLQKMLEGANIKLSGTVTNINGKSARKILEYNLNDEIDNFMKPEEKQESQVIQDVTGIGNTSAQTIIAVIGTDMERFPSDRHISSWAGLCPGDNVSAKKRKSGKIRKGNALLKSTLVLCAHAAVRHKSSYFHAQFKRISTHRGKKRAYVAVAHSILIAIYHILKDGVKYQDLGAEYYNQFNAERKIHAYLKKLKALGWEPPKEAVPA